MFTWETFPRPVLSQEELHSVLKILLYAPGTQEGLKIMMNILEDLEVTTQDGKCEKGSSGWILLPMESKVDLESSDLGDILEHALDRARNLTKEAVIFLGMDSPVLPLDDIRKAILSPGEAYLCPADDGGYGMLSIPSQADPAKSFDEIPWSQSLTAMAQIKALTDQGINVKIGSLMYDIDEPDDVLQLCERIRSNDIEKSDGHILDRATVGSNATASSHALLSRTKQALRSANLL
jgi:Uncharacterized protein conserved in bacteria (DUF2064)